MPFVLAYDLRGRGDSDKPPQALKEVHAFLAS